MYKAVVFDVDGTLINTEESILRSLKKLLMEELNEAYQDEELAFVLGIPGEYSILEFKLNDPKTALEKWCLYMEQTRDCNKLYEGVETVLKELESMHVLTGIVTSRTRVECDTDPLLQSLLRYVDHCICADDTEKHKPNGEPLVKFLEDLNLQPDEVFYIGDTVYDQGCAENAGVEFVLAGWGTHEPVDQQKVHVMMHPYEIMAYLHCHTPMKHIG